MEYVEFGLCDCFEYVYVEFFGGCGGVFVGVCYCNGVDWFFLILQDFDFDCCGQDDQGQYDGCVDVEMQMMLWWGWCWCGSYWVMLVVL